jgi:vancomycin resistance protein VanW
MLPDIHIPSPLPSVGCDRLSHRNRLVYELGIRWFRMKRNLRWLLQKEPFAKERAEGALPFRVHKHSSVLVRKLGDTDPVLQQQKIINIKIASACMHEVIIRPGEVFSFCRLVGNPTRRRGFVEGLQLSRGKAISGIGGGICQIANLIHWLVLHSPLTVVERSQHSYDPFPDEGRIIPFGTGAAIFYNYVDYQFRNDTTDTFQLRLWLTEKALEGELRCDRDLEHKYHVSEKNHAFLKIGSVFYRTNQIWQYRTLKCRSEIEQEKLVTRNFAVVKYHPNDYIDVSGLQSGFMDKSLETTEDEG